MRAEWLRRLVCVGTCATIAWSMRHVEPAFTRATGLKGVWITMPITLATLVLCFKLADQIPDSHWPTSLRIIGIGHAVVLLIMLIWLAIILGLTAGKAH